MSPMSDQPNPARSFGSVADAYDRGRPGYPAEAASWLAGAEPALVLEIGAGTGKLTEALTALGHEVHATDPDDAMLAKLRARLPDVPTAVASAEKLPAKDATYDVVVAGQAFHWFDHEQALPEIARVLRPRGRLALVWNARDEQIPWVRKLGRIIGTPRQPRDAAPIEASPYFTTVEEESFRHWQLVDRSSIQDLAASRSSLAVLDDEARDAKLADVLALYDDYGRGMDGMQLPYVATCFRATVADRIFSDSSEPGNEAADSPRDKPAESDDVLLIDFS